MKRAPTHRVAHTFLSMKPNRMQSFIHNGMETSHSSQQQQVTDCYSTDILKAMWEIIRALSKNVHIKEVESTCVIIWNMNEDRWRISWRDWKLVQWASLGSWLECQRGNCFHFLYFCWVKTTTWFCWQMKIFI